jgi:hypothetical protein
VSYNKNFGYHNLTVMAGTGAYVDNNSVGNGVTYYNLPVNSFKEASMNFATVAADILAWGNESYKHKISPSTVVLFMTIMINTCSPVLSAVTVLPGLVRIKNTATSPRVLLVGWCQEKISSPPTMWFLS